MDGGFRTESYTLSTFNTLVKEEEIPKKGLRRSHCSWKQQQQKKENEVSWEPRKVSISKWRKKPLWDLALWRLLTKAVGIGAS